MIKVVKNRCSNTERQNIWAKFAKKSPLTLNKGVNFSWGEKAIHRMVLKERK
jgi:hypothetical protein